MKSLKHRYAEWKYNGGWVDKSDLVGPCPHFLWVGVAIYIALAMGLAGLAGLVRIE